MSEPNPVSIVMIEDDDGHARLIEKNIRRAGVNNEIVPFVNGTDAVAYLFGKDGSDCKEISLRYGLLPRSVFRLETPGEERFVSGSVDTRPATGGFAVSDSDAAADGDHRAVGQQHGVVVAAPDLHRMRRLRLPA